MNTIFQILKVNEFGHNCPDTTTPTGCESRLDAGKKEWEILGTCIKAGAEAQADGSGFYPVFPQVKTLKRPELSFAREGERPSKCRSWGYYQHVRLTITIANADYNANHEEGLN